MCQLPTSDPLDLLQISSRVVQLACQKIDIGPATVSSNRCFQITCSHPFSRLRKRLERCRNTTRQQPREPHTTQCNQNSQTEIQSNGFECGATDGICRQGDLTQGDNITRSIEEWSDSYIVCFIATHTRRTASL